MISWPIRRWNRPLVRQLAPLTQCESLLTAAATSARNLGRPRWPKLERPIVCLRACLLSLCFCL